MINKPYSFIDVDIQKLAANIPTCGEDWDNAVYSTLKGRIKGYYCRAQRQRCAYCDLELEQACHSEHIEHIVDKASHYQWMFEPYNLALSCSQCNTKKGAKNVLSQAARNAVVVPIGSRHYINSHPHFDEWDRNIEIFDELFVRAKTSKGERTIEICGLWRPLFADRRARHNGIALQDRIFYIVWHLQDPALPQDEKDEYLAYLVGLTNMIL